MRTQHYRVVLGLVAGLVAGPAVAQTAANLVALRGLAPVAALPGTAAGQAALAANFAVTGGIQAGTLRLPTLLPFAEQQQQALRDAFITGWNAAGLADALGTSLGGAYMARASYSSATAYTSLSPAIANLIAYTNETTAADSNAGKYFFANGTLDRRTPLTGAAAAILPPGGADVFGKAYGHPAGSAGADPYGNSRPFQTLPSLLPIVGADYFGLPSSNTNELRGPGTDLTDSPAYPSGHTTYGTVESLLLAILVPQRYTQAVTRAAEYGDDRIILGAHYAMDVLAGRTLAMHDLAHLLANDPAYVGQPKRRATVITDYMAAIRQAQAEMRMALEAGCGAAIAVCAANDDSRFRNPAANQAFYDATQTYGLPVVHANTAAGPEDVAVVAPEAGYLLTAAFPYLTLDQANAILTATQGPGGGFLDDGSNFGLYSRLNLHAASLRAAAMAH